MRDNALGRRSLLTSEVWGLTENVNESRSSSFGKVVILTLPTVSRTCWLNMFYPASPALAISITLIALCVPAVAPSAAAAKQLGSQLFSKKRVDHLISVCCLVQYVPFELHWLTGRPNPYRSAGPLAAFVSRGYWTLGSVLWGWLAVGPGGLLNENTH